MALAVKRLISCDSSLIYVKIGSQVFSFFFSFFFLARRTPLIKELCLVVLPPPAPCRTGSVWLALSCCVSWDDLLMSVEWRMAGGAISPITKIFK